MQEFFQNLLKPINLLLLFFAIIGIAVSLFIEYGWLGFSTINYHQRSSFLWIPKLLNGIVLVGVAIQLIVKYNARVASAIILLALLIALLPHNPLIQLIPREFWEFLATNSSGFIPLLFLFIPIFLVGIYAIYRWYRNRHN